MIKLCLRPGLLIVARFAFFSFLPFVFVVFLVAGNTSALYLVFIDIALVAAAAFNFFMLGEQRILGLLCMVEQNFFPFSLDMATFAFGAKTAFVFIVFLVTGKTVHRQFFFGHIALVTATAFRGQMLAQQGIFGFFGMVEQDLFPALLKVTALAFLAEITLVRIIFLVAGKAGFLEFFFLYITLVTERAFQFFMFPEQGIFGLFCMVENDFFPAFFHVASFAFCPKVTLVLVVFFVTGET